MRLQAAGAPVVEIHTGAYAEAGACAGEELERIRAAAAHAAGLGLKVNAGHGLHYHNVQPIAAIPRSPSSTSATPSWRTRCSSALRRPCAR